MFRKLSIKDLYVQLIIINFVIFLLANLARSINSPIFFKYVAMPINIQDFFPRFWTIVTYQFLHVDFGHVFNNMIVLLLFGYFAQYFFNKQTVLSIYLIGGLCGAILVLLISTTIGFHNVLLGASCSVLAVMVATAIYKPNFVVRLFIFGTVKIKWIALALFVIGTVIDFTGNFIGNIGHLGGALFGLYYGLHRRNTTKDILQPLSNWFKKIGIGNEKPKVKVTSKVSTYEKKKTLDMNEILDKVSKSGVNSLSKEEKEYLTNLK